MTERGTGIITKNTCESFSDLLGKNIANLWDSNTGMVLKSFEHKILMRELVCKRTPRKANIYSFSLKPLSQTGKKSIVYYRQQYLHTKCFAKKSITVFAGVDLTLRWVNLLGKLGLIKQIFWCWLQRQRSFPVAKVWKRLRYLWSSHQV